MKILIGKETVIVRGMRPEENWWGKYQFPRPYRLKDRIAVSVHVEDDTIITTGNPTRWFETYDNGHSFKQHSHMEYKADGYKYPYLSGGFSDSDFEFFDDGSMIWFLRSTWMGSTGFEWAPMYFSRSYDGGKSWTEPEIFSDCGVLPRLCRLECGVTLLC